MSVFEDFIGDVENHHEEEVGDNGHPDVNVGTGETGITNPNASNPEVSDSAGPADQPTPNVEQETGTKPRPTNAKAARIAAQTIRDNEAARHEQLTNVVRTAFGEYKAGAIRLTKREMATWRDQLFQLHTSVINAHREYVQSFPDITEDERGEHDAWEAQFETDHGSIFQFADKYSRSRSDVSSMTSQATSTVSTSTKCSSTSSTKKFQETFNDLATRLESKIQQSNVEAMAEFRSDLRRSNAEALAEFRKANNDTLDLFFKRSSDDTCNQLAAVWKTVEEKIEAANVKTCRELGQQFTEKMQELNNQVTQRLEDTKTQINQNVTQKLAQVTTEVASSTTKTNELRTELAAESRSLRAAIQSVSEEVDKKIASSESDLRDRIYRGDEAQRDATDALQDAINRLNAEKKTVAEKGTKTLGLLSLLSSLQSLASLQRRQQDRSLSKKPSSNVVR
jgi:hypothetical protein